jgi:enoyl-CoA hydratase / 3-hydroxyacyl-CoA dehydrogenase
MNATGVPIAYHSTVSLGNELGDFYRPGDRLKEQFEKEEPWVLEGEVDSSLDIRSIIERRLLGAVFTVASQLVEEGVASIEDTDLGAKVGLRWKYGPFEMMNYQGIHQSFEIVRDFVERYPDLELPKLLNRQYDSGDPWSISYVNLKVEGEIARILFNRPEAMNAINEVVMQQLDQRFTTAENDPDVRTIVLEGAGKAFVAGADIEYFIRKIDEGRIQDIVEFTKFGHSVLTKIDNSKKLVIAKVHGIALGGGAEIALAADTIVASERASIGFPETGIGIYPGLGGTQRTTRYLGKELAKYLIFTGKIINSEKAVSMGLVEYVVPGAEIDDKINELARGKRKSVATKSGPGKETAKLPERYETIKGYFSDENIGSLFAQGEELDEPAKRIAKNISRKAPIALRLAQKLIDEGGGVGLDEGLQMELDHLIEIFSTKDAYEGLSSVVERRRPKFTGE